MFEDFRKQVDDSSFQDNNQQEETPVEIVHRQRHFLGMTPFQRFIVALMLMLMIIILGVLFLLVTAKIVPPFLS